MVLAQSYVSVAITIVLVAATFVQSHQLLYLGLRLAEQVNYGLDVVRLRKEVEGAHGGDAVAALCECAQVAGERGRVAGDVGDATRAERDDAAHRFGFRACARRVEEDEVRVAESFGVPREPVGDRRGLDARVRERGVGKVAAGILR